jgi:hypothetical protein
MPINMFRDGLLPTAMDTILATFVASGKALIQLNIEFDTNIPISTLIQ